MPILKNLLFFFCFFYTISFIGQITYIENFNDKGIPTNIPNGSYWKYFNDIHPYQNTWEKFIPGDGFAYIKVDADIHNDTDTTYPYQTMVFGGATENHRIEVRMRGTVVDCVLQDSFNTNIAAGWDEVIIGFRNLSWAKDFNWTGKHYLVVDYFKVQYLNSLSIKDNSISKIKEVVVYPNPAQNELNIISKDFYNINKIDISNLSTGLYLVNTYFIDGSIITKKLMKK